MMARLRWLHVTAMLMTLSCFAASHSSSYKPPPFTGVLKTEMVWTDNRTATEAALLYQALAAGYRDVHRVATRPLMHIKDRSPSPARVRLFLTSAFLDTRFLYYGRRAVLRVMLITPTERHGGQFWCRWVTGQSGAGWSYSKLQQVELYGGRLDGNEYEDVIGTCATPVTEQRLRDGRDVPRFLTVVEKLSENVTDQAAWVHVNVVPLVAADAAAVHLRYLWPGVRPGPYLTPEQYEAADGEVASCTKALMGREVLATRILAWLQFLKITGVSKVTVYDLAVGPLTSKLLREQEDAGLVEVYDLLLSRRLPRPGHVGRDGCHPSSSGIGGEWMDCLPTDHHHVQLVYWAQLTTTSHCVMNAMGRYRWVLTLDPDEWLVPRLQPAVTYSQLFKQVGLKTKYKGSGLDGWGWLDEAASGARWPAAYMFLNSFVESTCGSQFHNTSAHPWTSPALEVLVPPASDLPPAWLEPRPSLHEILWHAVRSYHIWEEGVRSKFAVDPLAVYITSVHKLIKTWPLTGSSSIRIPTGRAGMWVALHPAAALMYHTRFTHTHWNGSLLAMQAATRQAWRDVGALGGGPVHRDGVYMLQNCIPASGEGILIVDFTLANLYGRQLMEALRPFSAVYHDVDV